jgi:hypothetical protein
VLTVLSSASGGDLWWDITSWCDRCSCGRTECQRKTVLAKKRENSALWVGTEKA